MWPFTAPRQPKASADEIVIAGLQYELAEVRAALSEEKARSREKGRLASELLSERDAARIERDTAQDERDRYREQVLLLHAKIERMTGGLRNHKPKPTPNGAQEVRA